MCDKGRGVEANDKTAREWYRIAAENQHPIGQFNYGVFLMQGRGGIKDRTEGWNWIEKSSVQGYAPAQRAIINRPMDE